MYTDEQIRELAEEYAKNHSIYDSAQDDVYHGFVEGFKAAQELFLYGPPLND